MPKNKNNILVRILVFVVLINTPNPCYAESRYGLVSFYHEPQLTSSGERFRPLDMTCAHRYLPFGTIIVVQRGKHEAECRVNDRGPGVRGRILDVSLGVARKLGMTNSGVVSAVISY
jgi:rare lipoprotein A